MSVYGSFPATRMRRLRRSPWLRDIVRETRLHPADFILPVFVTEEKETAPVPGFFGVCRYPVHALPALLREVSAAGVRAVMLFPHIAPEKKDETGSEALREGNLLQQAIKACKDAAPEIGVICDIALDPYTSHGHDGVVKNGVILNDETTERLADLAAFAAVSGADTVAPSDMMDGRIGVIRKALDQAGLRGVSILSYAAKYASHCYGPFRDAVGSKAALGGADKNTYQMDFGNSKEAFAEAALDIEEGADILMIKPAVPYLDIVKGISDTFTAPVFVYHVSAEYVMLRAAAEHTGTDADALMSEYMVACKRAGARCIVTYGALDMARLCAGG